MERYVTLLEVSKVGQDTGNYLTPDTLLPFAAVNLLTYSSKKAFMLREGKKNASLQHAL